MTTASTASSYATEQYHHSMTESKPHASMYSYDDTTDESVRKQYENMSYDEMSKHLAESYKQLTEVLHNSRHSVPLDIDDSTLQIHGEEEVLDDEQLLNHADDETKRSQLNKIFSRAASSGDLEKVTQLLNDKRTRPFIEIDAKDHDGTTPLIYAACFGKAEIAQALLTAGANIDIQDSFGWSALMWATSNNHNDLVKILLEHGASAQTKSAKGRTVFDFVNTDNQKIVDILAVNPRDSVSSTSSILGRTTVGSVSSTSSTADDCDFYYQSTVEAFDSFMAEETERRQKLLESAMGPLTFDDDDDDDDKDDDFQQDTEFCWDKCMPDQMFVFSADDLNHILDTVINNVQLPVASRQEICIPANVIFLSARFAHYFSTSDLLSECLDGALSRMRKLIKENAHNVHVLSFWITNFTQLLYYLKKDGGLVVATAEYQLTLSELISETYMFIIGDTERRLAKMLVPAMLAFEQIPGMEDLNFVDDWQRFFRRNNRRSTFFQSEETNGVSMKRTGSTSSMLATDASDVTSPRSITNLLSTTFHVLQEYEVHPTIIIQALAQFFHYMSCEVFNHILTTKKMLSRSKALQVRMNLSHIEDWVRHNRLPSSLNSYLTPSTQLLQLLQCLSQLNDLASFINTVKKFDALNALQIKRCVLNYRYEVNEPRLPEEIEKYVQQLAEDTIRYKQARKLRSVERARRSAPPMSRTQSALLQRSRSRHESMTNFVGSLMSSVGITASTSLPPSLPSTPTSTAHSSEPSSNSKSSTSSDEKRDVAPTSDVVSTSKDEEDTDDDDEEEKNVKETRDSKFMLPFSVPTTAHMAFNYSWAPVDANHDKAHRVTPVIPESWMDRLDKGTACDA
ncbi:uncharacterized protein BYT42DRAFT_610492 [Radiomyces spectabilis]|uniref:uncharacterized protein n=1 Tax=Radiomyces spectabilis TaxID=64574 RepID=UPI00221F4582|nr:uncharacterized protein BYT42DRAFT_610492 [Radiomyces spectabilis]KAI8391245.1 hypothetical protein BYT42DRAFT_610492 [Radiomyces spectabilis]